MAILNRNRFPMTFTWGGCTSLDKTYINWIENGKDHRIFGYKDYNDTDYWYIEIMHGDVFYSFPLETLIPDDVLYNIRQGKVVLILSNFSESYHSIIEDIYIHTVINGKIPPEQILLYTNSPDIIQEINFISNQFNQNPIKAHLLFEFEMGASNTIAYSADKSEESRCYTSKTLEIADYPKKYLSYNGMRRPQRVSIVALLASMDLLKHGYVSYNSYVRSDADNIDAKRNYDEMLLWHIENPRFIDILQNNKDTLLNLNSLYLDTEPGITSGRAGYHQITKQFYEETYFSIVTETLCMKKFSNDGKTGMGRILSEKTFKAILNHHPFLLVAVPRSLQFLKSMGYKTFHPYINEDYDNEADDSKRILMIADEVKRLCELSPEQLQEFLLATKEIVNYNFQVLKSKKGPWLIPLIN